MIKLDRSLLAELGLADLPPAEQNLLLGQMYETLEMRVGMALAGLMSDTHLDEFEHLIDRADEGGALRWLEVNFPDYKEVVAAAFSDLKAEVRAVASAIIEHAVDTGTHAEGVPAPKRSQDSQDRRRGKSDPQRGTG